MLGGGEVATRTGSQAAPGASVTSGLTTSAHSRTSRAPRRRCWASTKASTAPAPATRRITPRCVPIERHGGRRRQYRALALFSNPPRVSTQACVFSNYNILSLYGPRIPYNVCRNLEVSPTPQSHSATYMGDRVSLIHRYAGAFFYSGRCVRPAVRCPGRVTTQLYSPLHRGISRLQAWALALTAPTRPLAARLATPPLTSSTCAVAMTRPLRISCAL